MKHHNIIINGLISIFVLISTVCSAQNFINPILRGAHPDPSICRVGDDFYLVNSTFGHFPGLCINHSKDLVNWELIGYGLDRIDQSAKVGFHIMGQNGGIHAPTIRYYNGTFYIITTSMFKDPSEKLQGNCNFIITAKDPAGPWSDPHIIPGAGGIDPDLFFDDNGKVWYIGTCDPSDVYAPGIGSIYGQEIDLNKWKLVGERYRLWNGACGGFCAEGPHMYKKNGVYYLMIAEGGTGFEHSEVIAASRNITGPFESNLRNPIITSRHLSKNNWVNSSGHADLVELADGRWYMVLLGMRNEDPEGRSNMGRETHLVPVIWEEDGRHWLKDRFWWPVCAPETGRVERVTATPFKGVQQEYNDAFSDNFDSKKLNLEWNFIRAPYEYPYSLTARNGYLRLYAKPEVIKVGGIFSWMGILQKETEFEYSVSMNFNPKKEGVEAGISLVQLDNNYINMTIRKENGKAKLVLTIARRSRNTDTEVFASRVLDNYKGQIIFKVVSNNNEYNYYYSVDNGNTFEHFTTTPDNLILCYSYSGARLGVYATSNGNPTKEYADFDWVSYKGFVRH